MTKYDQVDVLLSQQIPGWQNDWLDSWLVEKAKARWADSHPMEEDGTPEHVDYIVTYMAQVTTLPYDQLDKILQHAAGGIYRGPGSSKRFDKIKAKQAARAPAPDEFVGAGETLRLMRPEEAAEIAQRNRSRHRFMTPEEYRRQQEEQASHMGRMSRFKLRDPNERDEHAGLVSHSIPVPRARDIRDR
jgi:hypothetical protein